MNNIFNWVLDHQIESFRQAPVPPEVLDVYQQYKTIIQAIWSTPLLFHGTGRYHYALENPEAGKYAGTSSSLVDVLEKLVTEGMQPQR